MQHYNPALFLLVFLILILPSACTTDEYAEQMIADRSQRDFFFKFSDESPLTASQKDDFSGLVYFPPDKQYIVEAIFEKDENLPPLVVEMDEERKATFKGLGKVSFTLNNKEITLNAYEPPRFLTQKRSRPILFIPFYDETNSQQTFEGGRYLDVFWEEEAPFTLDFNKAYNPFCKYNPDYFCPEPPDFNTLPLEIRAGEKRLRDQLIP